MRFRIIYHQVSMVRLILVLSIQTGSIPLSALSMSLGLVIASSYLFGLELKVYCLAICLAKFSLSMVGTP